MGRNALIQMLGSFPRSRHDIAVVTFHRVDSAPEFGNLLDALGRCADFVSLTDFISLCRSPSRSRHQRVLVTFDDGHRSVLENGLLEMEKRQVPGVLFVVAGLIGTNQPFWWDEAAALAEKGGRTKVAPNLKGDLLLERMKSIPEATRQEAMNELRASADGSAEQYHHLTQTDLERLERGDIEIANHSLTHPILANCDDATIEEEVSESTARLSSMLGHRPRAFAYPSGRIDDRVIDAVRRENYSVAFAWDHRLTAVPPPDRWRISRIQTDSMASRTRVAMLATGWHRSLRSVAETEAPPRTG